VETPHATVVSRAAKVRDTLIYFAMISVTIGLFLFIRLYGDSLAAPEAAGSARFGAATRSTPDTLLHVLLALAVVIVAARGTGAIFRRLHQPPVIGEVLAGIMLGPSLLGRFAPGVSAFLLPSAVAPYIGVMSQVGVILYLFVVGLELDTSLLRQRTRISIAVSHTSIVVPFSLGAALALWLYPRFSSSDVPFTAFALFMGVAMSVTAFPVLARILTDRQMHTSDIGALALTCAAVGDVTAWCLLAFVVGVVRAQAGQALVTVALTAAFIAAMWVLVRPAVRWLVRFHDAHGRPTQRTLAIACVALLASALTTESIGIHALFGAFLLGAVVPHDSNLARDLKAKLNDLVVVLLLPPFFAFTGLRTEIGLVSGVGAWLACGLIILVAALGKIGGSAVAARLTGLDWRHATGLGVLMNTRGLMELVVLNVGLDLGVLSPTLFAMLVIMALVTTLATTPVFDRLRLDRAGL
jgi:Kef-type K+ transport system membrane component KefB